MKNINEYLKSLETRLQVNQFFLYRRNKENSEWKQMPQDMQ